MKYKFLGGRTMHQECMGNLTNRECKVIKISQVDLPQKPTSDSPVANILIYLHPAMDDEL